MRTKLKILIVNKYFYRRGGDCTYTFALKDLLESYGHTVIPFSMHHPLNFQSEYSRYFVSEIDYMDALKRPDFLSAIQVAARSIYSISARKRIEALIRDTEPDLVHLQNIHHHITPSVLHSIKKFNIPVVWTLHDYVLICPNDSFVSHGHICEQCKGGKYYRTVFEQCKKGSLGASLLASLQPYIYRALRLYDLVDIFIAPSNFLRRKMVEFGFPAQKVIHIPNFLNIYTFEPNYNHSDYFLYLGHLSPIKGIRRLIKAMEEIAGGRLLVVGEGELKREMTDYVRERGMSNVEFLGRRTGQELKSIFRGAMFLVMPSEWYENCPYSILEAFAYGKPVLASRIGGIPEIVDDGVNGLLFEMRNVDELAEKIDYLLGNRKLLENMGKNGRRKVEKFYKSERYYGRMMSIYENLL